jgi:hypothetical protein
MWLPSSPHSQHSQLSSTLPPLQHARQMVEILTSMPVECPMATRPCSCPPNKTWRHTHTLTYSHTHTQVHKSKCCCSALAKLVDINRSVPAQLFKIVGQCSCLPNIMWRHTHSHTFTHILTHSHTNTHTYTHTHTQIHTFKCCCSALAKLVDIDWSVPAQLFKIVSQCSCLPITKCGASHT